MDARPPPPVTINGGPGWSPDGPHETLGEADEPPQGRSPSWLGRHRIGGLALATAAGFALATGLAELRMTTIEESAEGVLSLEIRVESNSSNFGGGDVVAAADGRLSLATSVLIHNTGPRPVALERAELLGTTYGSDELRGRRVADGEESIIVLMRSIDCARLDRTPTPGPLRVHATTGAGTRTVDLRMNTAIVQAHDEQARGYCGQNEPGAALLVQEQRAILDGAVLVIGLSVSNMSARPLSVERLITVPGLRVAGVTSRDSAPVALPLRLEPGDFDPPVDPFLGRGPEVEVAVRLEIEDCAVYRPPTPNTFEPAATVQVTGGRLAHGLGTDPAVLERLSEVACGGVDVEGRNRLQRVRALTGPGDPGDLPQGAYRFALTREQLLADGLSVQEADGNAGVFTYTLRAGRWRYEQQPAVPGNAISAMTTCEGWYTVRGDTASFTTTTTYDGGSCSPPTWAARWTADAENLVWNDNTEPDFGFFFGSMPWQRIED